MTSTRSKPFPVSTVKQLVAETIQKEAIKIILFGKRLFQDNVHEYFLFYLYEGWVKCLT